MILQPLANIAALCAAHQLTEFIVSPGSRCAPLTLALVRHPAIRTRTISDERAAAFIALGIAQATQQTVGLVCTSGTAALNYAPAIAEAYYQEVPLLVLTADRPPEWIAQQDGQTIRQTEVYGKHVKGSFQLPADYSHPDSVWFINRVVNEAINLAKAFPCGPVHINVPIREPFYPEVGEEMTFDENPRVIEEWHNSAQQPKHAYMNLAKEWLGFSKKMMVVGQHAPNDDLANAVHACGVYAQTPVVSDIIGNVHKAETICNAHDLLLMSKSAEMKRELQPELLITVGNSLISKNLKLFLREYKPQQHWHIQEAGQVADAFGTLTRIIRCKPADFFTKMGEQSYFTNIDDTPNTYADAWKEHNEQARNLFNTLIDNGLKSFGFTEFEAVKQVISSLPQQSHLHLANSMSVRYANFVGLSPKQEVKVWSNRGTSGIDGCTATAVGTALATHEIVTLITGDVAFFYDRNALWHNYLPNNLRIILLNNNGGGIFKMIDGPARQPEASEYFETYQALNAERTCADVGIAYTHCSNETELALVLQNFFAPHTSSKLLEISTKTEKNAVFFAEIKRSLAAYNIS